MDRTPKAKKECGQLSLYGTFFGDSCLSIVKTVEDYNVEGVDYCRSIMTSHRVFYLDKCKY